MQKIISFVVKELIFWYVIPLIFLALYVGNYHKSISAVYAHLYAISLIALIMLLIKVVLYLLISKKNLALLLSSLVYAITLFCLIFYYCLVIIGLKSWGKVISEELISSYALQAGQLSEAAGLSFIVAILVCIVLFILIALSSYLIMRNPCLLLDITKKIKLPKLLCILLFSLSLLMTFQLLDNYAYADFSKDEPFNLTLFSGKSNPSSKNSHHILANNKFDKEEDLVKRQYKVSENANHKNLIIIIVDALRPDHMGVYGYQRETTPYLSSLAEQGNITLLNKAHASCGESACGLSSIATSKYTHQQPSNPFTLQQVLQLHHYKINMILGGDHTNFYNLKSLYGDVDSYFDGSMAKGYYMNDDKFIIDKVRSLPVWDKKPTMIQFHLMSAHTIGKHDPKYEKFHPHRSYAGHSSGKPKQEYTNHYDNGVIQADAVIKELISLLDSKKYLSNSLIVITADHGESLGEHQLFNHANSVYEELLQIPLLMINSDKKVTLQLLSHTFISQVDIAPTILHELQIAIPNSWQGAPIQVNQLADKEAFTFFQLLPNIGIYDHRQPNKLLKYWVNVQTREEFIFNISQDPNEQYNLIWQVPTALKYELRKKAYSTYPH